MEDGAYCPACRAPVSRHDAAQAYESNPFPVEGERVPDTRKFRCPTCKAHLKYVVPLFRTNTSGFVWVNTTKPGDT